MIVLRGRPQARRQRETGENVVIRCFSRFAVGG
jgi:hypothetical protein